MSASPAANGSSTTAILAASGSFTILDLGEDPVLYREMYRQDSIDHDIDVVNRYRDTFEEV
jgi:hypothetical protein